MSAPSTQQTTPKPSVKTRLKALGNRLSAMLSNGQDKIASALDRFQAAIRKVQRWVAQLLGIMAHPEHWLGTFIGLFFLVVLMLDGRHLIWRSLGFFGMDAAWIARAWNWAIGRTGGNGEVVDWITEAFATIVHKAHYLTALVAGLYVVNLILKRYADPVAAIVHVVDHARPNKAPILSVRPCTPSDLEKIVALAHDAFGWSDKRFHADRAAMFNAWYTANPNVFQCIIEPQGRIVGYFSMVPLRSDIYERHMHGRMSQFSIRQEDVVNGPCDQVYVNAIYLQRRYRHRGELTLILEAMNAQLILLTQGARAPVVYGEAFTPAGKGLLKKLGFTKRGYSYDFRRIYALKMDEPLNEDGERTRNLYRGKLSSSLA